MLSVLIVLVALIASVLFAVIFVPGLFSGESNDSASQVSKMVQTQRNVKTNKASEQDNRDGRFTETAERAQVHKLRTSELNLTKKLKYARWKMPPIAYYLLMLGISVVAFYFVSIRFNRVLTICSLFSGPLFMSWLLTQSIDRRFKAFDADFPAFLQSLVSLLKIGQNPMSAITAGVEALPDHSLVKFEVNMMMDRLRLGVSEDQSIGAFAEDVYHPEIELFVQALLLSRRVGGNLSDTLERLAKQVRKRQYFRSSAVAAVSMQKGSIWFILAIMCVLLLYIFYAQPQAILKGIRDPIGWQVWQGGILLILLGVFWVRQITKMKI